MSYTHFTLSERKYLQQLLAEGYSFRKIAEFLERSPSSISREVKRNHAKFPTHKKSDNKYRYNHWRAHNCYTRRRREKVRQALRPGTPEWNYIVEKLQLFWSPETICGRWHLKYPHRKPLCASTIYRYIKKGRFPKITQKKNLRRRGKRIQTRNANYNSIQPDRIIPQWPQVIQCRERIGDWEGDTVCGGIGKGALVSFVDRRSRYLRLGLLASRSAEETRCAIEKMMKNLPVESISLDNGSEFSQFRTLEKNLHTFVYFAQPHKPWQRGTNENTNDIIRFFFPKGFDFRNLSELDILLVESLINHRPRKCLGWLTPFEVFFNSVALT